MKAITISRTVREIMDSGDWEWFCEAFGYNAWMLKEGRAESMDALTGEVYAKPEVDTALQELLEASREAMRASGLVELAFADIEGVSLTDDQWHFLDGLEDATARLQKALEPWEGK